MSEVGEISQVMNVMLNGSQIACSITKDFLTLLKRMTQVLFNLPDAWVSKKLKKDSGHSKLKYLQIKDNVHSYILSDDCYQFLKKNAKKYNVQWADSPVVRKDEKSRVFIASNDLVQFKALLEDYEKITGRNATEACQKQSLPDFMLDSGLAKCTDKEFDEAMINAFGKNYKKVTEADLLASDMSNEKKNEVVKILKFNQLNKLINDEDNVSYNFSVSDVVAEKNDKYLVPVKNSFSDYAWIDKNYIHEMPDLNDNTQNLVAVMSSEDELQILDKSSGYERNVNFESYSEGIDNAYNANINDDLNVNLDGVMQYDKDDVLNLISELLPEDLKSESESQNDLSDEQILMLTSMKTVAEDKKIFKFAFADVKKERENQILVPVQGADKFIWIDKNQTFEIPKSDGHDFVIVPGLEDTVSIADDTGKIEKKVLLNSYLEGVSATTDIESKLTFKENKISEKVLNDELEVSEASKTSEIGIGADDGNIGNYSIYADNEQNISRNDTFDYSNAADITISEVMKNEALSDDKNVVVRVPGMYGKNIGYIKINNDDIELINSGKTMLSHLKFDQEYPIYDENMKIKFKMTGDELYKKHYSKVEKSVRQRQQRRENLMKNRENKNIYYHNQDRKR